MKTLALSLLAILLATSVESQVPQSFKYQAVARDGTGNVLSDKMISLKISVLSGSVSGSVIYSEAHKKTTNTFGLFDLEIGKGNVLSGVFSTIDWGNNIWFVKVEFDPNGGTSYQTMGTSQLLSVPFALYAKDVQNNNDADADPTNEIQTLSISGTNLTLNKGGGTVTLPSSGGGDNWGTQVVKTNSSLTGQGTDSSPLGVVNTAVLPPWSNIQNIPSGFADGIDNVDDADNDITNEIQVLSINGSNLSLNKGGGTVSLPAAEGDKWGTQSVVSDATLSGNGTVATPLKIAQQAATTGQVLKWSGSTWSPGNDLAGSSFWQQSNNNVHYTTGRVGIGTESPLTTLSIYGKTLDSYLQFTTASSGTTLFDGLLVGSSQTSKNSWVWNYEDSPLFFGTNGTYRMTILGNGNVGIGTNSPAEKLHVSGNILLDNTRAVKMTTTSSYGELNTSGNNLKLTNFSGGNIEFSTSKTNIDPAFARLTINANGNVGVGANPSYKLDVAGNLNLNKGIVTGQAIMVNDAEALWYNGTYFSWGFGSVYNYFADAVTIGTTASPGYKLVVYGSAAKSDGSSWSIISDKRLKNITGNYQKGLTQIIALQPVKFTYKEGNPRELSAENEHIGFIAQEVQKIFPEAVSKADDGYLDFNIHAIHVAMVNAIKELKQINDDLSDKVKNLESRMEMMELTVKASASK